MRFKKISYHYNTLW